MEQPQIVRILRLLALLSGNILYTVEELADKLGVTKRTIYRYLGSFREAGFSVRKVRDHVYHLTSLSDGVADLSNIVYFSDEEAYIVNSMIEELDGSNPLRQGLLQKFSAVYDSTSMAERIGDGSHAKTIQVLGEAIRTKRVTVLHEYASSHSGETKDYKVEPFKFSPNYTGVWAFDQKDGLNKRFKIQRIGLVETLDEKWSHEYAHREVPMDAFRIHGEKEYHVILRMNNVARNLMIEEYPLTASNIFPEREYRDKNPLPESIKTELPFFGINPDEQTWIFDGHIRGMDGIGRFILGLEQNIEILAGEEIIEYLQWHTVELWSKYLNNESI